MITFLSIAREGNVFRGVCPFTRKVGRQTPSRWIPPIGWKPPEWRHPPPATDIWWRPLQRSVRILLECILVSSSVRISAQITLFFFLKGSIIELFTSHLVQKKRPHFLSNIYLSASFFGKEHHCHSLPEYVTHTFLMQPVNFGLKVWKI